MFAYLLAISVAMSNCPDIAKVKEFGIAIVDEKNIINIQTYKVTKNNVAVRYRRMSMTPGHSSYHFVYRHIGSSTHDNKPVVVYPGTPESLGTFRLLDNGDILISILNVDEKGIYSNGSTRVTPGDKRYTEIILGSGSINYGKAQEYFKLNRSCVYQRADLPFTIED